MPFMFEKMHVYQKALNLAEQITNTTEGTTSGHYYITDQLNRTVLTIANHIADAYGRGVAQERKHSLGMARSAVQECVPILELCQRKKIITSETHLPWKRELEEICHMLSGLIQGMPEPISE